MIIIIIAYNTDNKRQNVVFYPLELIILQETQNYFTELLEKHVRVWSYTEKYVSILVQNLVTIQPSGKSGPQAIFINRVLLEHSHIHSFIQCYNSIIATEFGWPTMPNVLIKVLYYKNNFLIYMYMYMNVQKLYIQYHFIFFQLIIQYHFRPPFFSFQD